MIGIDYREETRQTPLVCCKSQDDRGERWVRGIGLRLRMAIADGRNSGKFLGAYWRVESGATWELTGAGALRL